ncbi:LysR family transcriptional regulator [Streptomyces spectabilis]|uniref:DNA-binding transcriptional LysR family regulator n=1 Tax=Streptomyces spectabilis TaxID=68270 RepID=A0A5P2XF47_STRST|nr:LysR family transcriptional regulator [Streptomyces spectabilis]MBB5103769.1 DNA-binding transcriptional LysR family regulator [Streptomyces spectabilis]MCI3903991.1 LysR family transcriptional regulator [Streptomyces spectabilis]QEV61136.1 LysR family transcriptional regulator [Streptomyces spectabilis]GGV18894.1 putative transcriptional regulator, LysR family protein [Streptomyces spectabilis]
MDLNLLRALDALLQENSVTRAAERLGTSPAAASRTLARLRRAVGDPLLVRAGQGMVPTPRALELREQVGALLRGCDDVLRPGAGFAARHLQRTFTVQAIDLLQAGLAGPLAERVRTEAPGVDVVFLPESGEGGPALRQGFLDVELGVLAHLDPETRTRQLARLTLVGVARAGHPLFDGPVDARRFAEPCHIGISRLGKRLGPIDAELAKLGLRRRVAVVVPSHTSALLLARDSDLVALTLPGWLPGATEALGLRTFPVPLPLPPIDLGMAWHPRNDADPGHRWFRDHLAAAVLAPQAAARPGPTGPG